MFSSIKHWRVQRQFRSRGHVDKVAAGDVATTSADYVASSVLVPTVPSLSPGYV